MPRFEASAVVLALTFALANLAAASTVTPVQQVVQMLSEMKTKGVMAMEVERKLMKEYTGWAGGRITDLGFEIKTTKSEIEQLVASIESAESKIAGLSTAIGGLEGEIAQLEADKKAATATRETEHASYLKASKDYSESVDALERAIQVLQSQAYDRPQAELLLQQMAAKTPGARRVLAAFLQEQVEERLRGAPAVAAYAFQSDTIVALLKKLLGRFRGELGDVESAEANAAHAYNLEVLHIGNTVDRMSADREEKAAMKGATTAESSKAQGELVAAKADLADDEQLLLDTKTTLAAKQSAFQRNQQVRKEELEALSQAVEIISDPSVADSYGKHIKLAQLAARPVTPHGLSLLQEASQAAVARATARTRAVKYLQARARAISSTVLGRVASDAAANPFAKVVQMIEGLLAKLKEEAAAEADHKDWCDGELKANKLRREKAVASVDRLRAEVDQLGAQIQGMAEEMKLLSSEQASLAKAMSEATEARTKEKAENEAAIADSQAAQEALKRALVILREFYSSQGAFLQRTRQVPEMKAYTGMQGSKGGVIGMLEVIESDFARLETETKADEAQAADAYAGFMENSKASAKQKHEREFKLKLEKDQAEFDQGRVKDDLAAAEEELSTANAYYANLKPSCLQVHVNYEERVAKRQEEIAALKEAYKILSSMSA